SLTAYLSEYDGDYLFYILTWCISNMIDNVLFYYVILHLFFLRNLIKGLKMINGYLLVTISLFIFINYSLYYNYSLNVLRQGLALSLIVLAIGYLIKDKGFKFFVSLALASLFHLSSALLSIVLVVI